MNQEEMGNRRDSQVSQGNGSRYVNLREVK